ncbi:hypothetical protein [Conexibacter sp. DBS9H8]|uniref:hypothetical protein n=1 Tax=Conexibacter sp. DBS9H8 TaxID=2937801 RepID=UPI00200FB4F3|nr:hypothetical protein [Conexibacter sp. DBS9H8]
MRPPHPRIRPILIAVALAGAALLAGCGAGQPARVATASRPAGHGSGRRPLSIMESDGLLYTNAPVLFSAARSLGVQVVRFNVLWSGYVTDPHSPSPPAGFAADNPASPGYDFTFLDALDREAAAAGVRLFLTVTGPPPRWARGAHPLLGRHGCGRCAQWEPVPAAYGAFVHALGTRYSGHFIAPGASTPLPRVSFWSLWNEPNYGPDLAPQSRLQGAGTLIVDTAAPQYRRLLAAGWAGLRSSGHTPGSDTILVGETAPVGELDPGIDNMTPPLQFLRDLYCVSSAYRPLTGAAAAAEGCPAGMSGGQFRADNPALFDASGWADHPYDYVVPPTVPQRAGADGANFADFARLPDLARALDRAAAAWGADPRLPIYNTEYGYFSDPPAHYDALAPATIARYMNWTEYLSWSDPRIASYDQYLLTDPAAASGSTFDTGLEFADGQPKPDIYAAFELPLWLTRTRLARPGTLPVWGCVRPLDTAPGTSGRVAIQYAPTGGGFRTLKTLTVNGRAGCYFDTTVRIGASGVLRLSFDPGHGAITSRSQAVVVG